MEIIVVGPLCKNSGLQCLRVPLWVSQALGLGIHPPPQGPSPVKAELGQPHKKFLHEVFLLQGQRNPPGTITCK